MANFGIMAGSAVSEGLNAFGKTLQAVQQVRDMKREAELDSAMRGIPNVGDDDTAGQKAAISTEGQRLGLKLDQAATIQDQLGQINQARTAQGAQGDFALPAARKFTADDRAAAVAAALEKSGDPRNIALASQMRMQALQAKHMNLQMSRDQFADAARKAVFMAKAGDEQGAMAAVQGAYNSYFPDGGSIQLAKDGDHVVGNVTTGDGRKVTLRAANAEEMANMAYSLSSGQAYEAMLGRQHQEKLTDKQIAGHLEASRISAGASIASAQIHAGAALQAAKIRESAENQRMGMLAPVYKAQVESLNAATRTHNLSADAAEQLRSDITDFHSMLAADPTNPKLAPLAVKLGQLDPRGMVEVTEKGVDAQGNPYSHGVLKNKYVQTLEAFQPAPVSPDQLNKIVTDITKSSKGKPLSDDDLSLLAKKYDAMAGRPGTFAASILPNLPSSLVPKQEEGMVQRGNIDLNNRPVVKNPDGSISTVRSITITDNNGRAILLPTVVGGKVVSNDEAVQHYKQTGENLGIFKTEDAANAYAEKLHQSQAARYAQPTRKAGLPVAPVDTGQGRGLRGD